MTNRYAKPNRYAPTGFVSCPTCEQKARAYVEPAPVRADVTHAIARTWNLPDVLELGDDPRDRWHDRLDVDDTELVQDATLAELHAALTQLDKEVQKEQARRDWLAGYLDNLAGGEA
jgi:hypothetical protein